MFLAISDREAGRKIGSLVDHAKTELSIECIRLNTEPETDYDAYSIYVFWLQTKEDFDKLTFFLARHYIFVQHDSYPKRIIKYDNMTFHSQINSDTLKMYIRYITKNQTEATVFVDEELFMTLSIQRLIEFEDES